MKSIRSFLSLSSLPPVPDWAVTSVSIFASYSLFSPLFAENRFVSSSPGISPGGGKLSGIYLSSEIFKQKMFCATFVNFPTKDEEFSVLSEF